MAYDTHTLHQLESRRVPHKLWRTLSHYLMACPLQQSPSPDCHSSPIVQVIVSIHESVDLLIAIGSESMRGGDVVYGLCYIDTVYLLFCVCIVLSNLRIFAVSQYSVCTWLFICRCPFHLKANSNRKLD